MHISGTALRTSVCTFATTYRKFKTGGFKYFKDQLQLIVLVHWDFSPIGSENEHYFQAAG